MRRRSPGSATTKPASESKARCLAMACRVIGSRAARSVAVAGPPWASAARIARRLGSARAVNTSCATASRSGLGIEVGYQLAKFVGPSLGVAGVCLVVAVGLGQLGEAGLHHGQGGAAAA